MSVSVDITPAHLWAQTAQAMCRLMHPALEFLHGFRQVKDFSCNPAGLRKMVFLLRLVEFKVVFDNI